MPVNKKVILTAKRQPQTKRQKNASLKDVVKPRRATFELNSEPDFEADFGSVDGADPLATRPDEEMAEEPLDEERPEIAAELAEDPVRLYLREIGAVKLLHADGEFHLATIIEAARFIGILRRRPNRKDTLPMAGIYHGLLSEM